MLLASIKALNKKFQKDILDDQYEDAWPIPTDSPALNAALGIGGLPGGKVIEIFGEESSGKTSLGLHAIAAYQKYVQPNRPGHEHRFCAVIDVEKSISTNFIKSFGIDTNRIIHIRPANVFEALEAARDLPRSGGIGITLFDSVASAQTAQQMTQDLSENGQMGNISKPMHTAMRSIIDVANETDSTYIFLNQIQYKLGVVFGNPRTTPGGKALPFYAALRLELLGGKIDKIPNTFLMRVKCEKNKVAAPYEGKVEILFEFAKGPHRGANLLRFAKDMNVARAAGPTTKIQLTPTDDPFTIKGGGVGFIQAVEDSAELYDSIMAACLRAANTV